MLDANVSTGHVINFSFQSQPHIVKAKSLRPKKQKKEQHYLKGNYYYNMCIPKEQGGCRRHRPCHLNYYCDKEKGKSVPTALQRCGCCLKLDGEQEATYRLSSFLADLSGGGLSLGRWWLSHLLLLRYRRLTTGRFAGCRLRRWQLSRWLLSLLAPSWALRWSRARWSLSRLLGGGADHRGRCGLLLDDWLCLLLDVSLGC